MSKFNLSTNIYIFTHCKKQTNQPTKAENKPNSKQEQPPQCTQQLCCRPRRAVVQCHLQLYYGNSCTGIENKQTAACSEVPVPPVTPLLPSHPCPVYNTSPWSAAHGGAEAGGTGSCPPAAAAGTGRDRHSLRLPKASAPLQESLPPEAKLFISRAPLSN